VFSESNSLSAAGASAARERFTWEASATAVAMLVNAMWSTDFMDA
jgi:hypothetical protein